MPLKFKNEWEILGVWKAGKSIYPLIRGKAKFARAQET
jgi:hypothetical protein